jgi:hypothetical protein
MNYLEVNNYFSDKFYNNLEYVNDYEVYKFIIMSCINWYESFVQREGRHFGFFF